MRDKSKRNVYHAISNSEKGWKVTKEGASRPSRHSREFGNPVIARPFLDSGSPLRCGRSKIPMPLAGNDEFSCQFNINKADAIERGKDLTNGIEREQVFYN